MVGISCRHRVLPLPCVVAPVRASPPSAPHATRGEHLNDFPKVVLMQVDPITALRWYYHWKIAALFKMQTVLNEVIWVLPS